MFKNPHFKSIVLAIAAVVTLIRERQYYQAHGRLSDGIIGAALTLAVMALASLIYGGVWLVRHRLRAPRGRR